MKLIGKIKIEGSIKLLSGLHIGGNQTTLEIGSVDNQVIKTNKGVPYIPGSSLKGKLRNMLARAAGSKDVKEDIELLEKKSDIKYIALLFGIPEINEPDNVKAEALLKIQDCFLEDKENRKFIEIKNENSIKRLTGEANPRQQERVVPNTAFSLNMILDVYEFEKVEDCLSELALAMKLLEMDHLGGGGSRGNGRVKFQIKQTEFYKIENLKLSANDDLKEKLSEFTNTVNTVL